MSALIIHSVGLERAEQNETIHILRWSRKRRTLIKAWVYAAAAPCILSGAWLTMPANMQLLQTHWQIFESYRSGWFWLDNIQVHALFSYLHVHVTILICATPEEKIRNGSLVPFSVKSRLGILPCAHAVQVCNMQVKWQLVCLSVQDGPCLRPRIAETVWRNRYRRWMEYSVWIRKSTLWQGDIY